MVMIDTILRLIPGAIDAESTTEESFTTGLLEYPQFTRPPEFAGLTVPAVLTGGNHEAVRKWRLKEALAPDAAPPAGAPRGTRRSARKRRSSSPRFGPKRPRCRGGRRRGDGARLERPPAED